MTVLLNPKIRHDEHLYELSLSWNEDAFAIDGRAEFTVAASILEPEDAMATVEATVLVERREDDALWLVVSATGYPGFEVPVSEIVEPESLAGAIVEAIPVPDPIIGCALRSGLSTVIDQVFACHRQAEDAEEGRVRSFFRCMKASTRRMASRCLFRFGCCMLRPV